MNAPCQSKQQSLSEGRCADFRQDPTAGQSWGGGQILSLCKALKLLGFSVFAVPISCESHVCKASLYSWNCAEGCLEVRGDPWVTCTNRWCCCSSHQPRAQLCRAGHSWLQSKTVLFGAPYPAGFNSHLFIPITTQAFFFTQNVLEVPNSSIQSLLTLLAKIYLMASLKSCKSSI